MEKKNHKQLPPFQKGENKTAVKVLYEILQLLKDWRTEMIVLWDPVASFKAQSRAFAQEMTYLCMGTNKHNLTILCGVGPTVKSLYEPPNVGVARRYGCGIMGHHYSGEVTKRVFIQCHKS